MSDQNLTVPAQTVDLTFLGQAIADGISKSQRRRMTFGEYEAKHKSPKLKRECFQNGYHLSYEGNTTPTAFKEVELLNKITHSGRYINRFVEVQLEQAGDTETLYLRWQCGTTDQRSEMKSKFRNFVDLLQQIVEAQEYERLEAEEIKEHKAEQRRKFGEGKATREAREKAGVA